MGFKTLMEYNNKSSQRLLEYDIVYMKMAENIATLSYAVKAKVGCIIVSPDQQIISHGWNGMPSGYDNCCEYINPENNHLTTKPEVIHSESAAILKCTQIGSSTKDATLYVTLSPCIDCAKLILQAGIKRVVFKDNYKNSFGINFLKQNNIIVQKLVNNQLFDNYE